ncbi:cobalt ECF transporter T component CbiQ [Desulfatitalea alkaliphila]|uniref:Cobalt ECF transporter T component CbiQ n=1 Tax=Desulfatitalea alkaliphila TaxID=2929485 RepID=A0AA41R1Z5_9BACT|nr:cobalt ECF transporter T component CbiQ [Desulfatitalea alkaliphila]MCJ8499355.1 cobalt ECF transporter T component CbiQ [Desulfatitalea alkaliphila]
MIEELFADGRSAIHRTDPALRVAAATLFSFTAALIDHVGALLLAVVFAAGLALAARLPARPLGKRLAAAGGLLLLVWVVLPLTYDGQPLLTVGPLTASREGVRLCLVITLKTIAILTAFTALVATMHLATLGHTLHRLGVPAKLVQLLLLAYRYAFVIAHEYQRLLRAARMRNFRPTTNLHTYKTYAYLVGMLFVRASERARRVHLAMKCRGFNGRFHSLDSYQATVWNPLLGAAVVLVSIVLTAMHWWG